MLEKEFDKIERVESRLLDLTELSNTMGYGGLIHDFKNYVIRGGNDYRIPDYLLKIEQDFVSFDQITRHLLDQSTIYASEKRKQIQIIHDTFSNYRTQAEKVRQLKSEGQSIPEIDKQILINDLPALKALEELQTLHRLEMVKIGAQIKEKAIFRQVTFIGFIFLINAIIVWFLYHFYLRKVVLKPLEDLKGYTDLLDKHFVVSKTNLKGEITYANERFCEISGYRYEELIGQNHNIVRHPDTPHTLFRTLWDDISRGDVWSGILKNKRKDGQPYTVKTIILPLRDENNRIEEYISIRVDISEQVENEKALAIQTLKTECAFDHQESFVALVNQETHNIEYANKGFKRFFRLQSEEFSNDENPISIHSLRVIPFQELIKKFNDEKNQGADTGRDTLTLHIFHKTYVFKWLMTDVVLEQPMYVLSLTDITQIENLKIEALAAKESQALFLANMSHEVRTPLNGILGFADMLSKTSLDKEQAWYVDILVDSSHKLLSVVNDILDFSKLEKGEMQISPEVESIHVDLFRSLNLFAPVAMQKNIEMNIHIASNLPEHLKYDSLRVNQIMTNLISNALKFTPENGRIQVDIEEARREGLTSFITFSVTDNGIGIPCDVQEKIFESFKQADSSTAKNYGGTGLGLAISNKLVEKMGGERILIESSPSKGARFYFTLPMERVDKRPLAEEMAGVKMAVLLDDTDLSNQLVQFLHDLKIEYSCIQWPEQRFDEKKKTCEQKWDEASLAAFNLILVVNAQVYEQYASALSPNAEFIFFYPPSDEDPSKHNVQVLLDFPQNRSQLYNLFLELMVNRKLSNADDDHPMVQKILLAEDNSVNQKLMDVYLRKLNIEYDLARNGQEAVDFYQAHPYPFILMDINMPIKGGKEALKDIREFERIKGLSPSAIFALTANVMKDDVRHYEEIGFDGHIPKPTKLEHIRNAIETHLIQKMARRSKSQDTSHTSATELSE